MNRRELVKSEEGLRLSPYHCTEGYPTVGYGKKIGPKWSSLSNYQFRITEEIADIWLDEELAKIENALITNNTYNKLNQARKDILVSMAYQMGLTGVYKFRKMWAALKDEDWQEAAKQALDSRWAHQTPARAYRHANVLERGSFN